MSRNIKFSRHSSRHISAVHRPSTTQVRLTRTTAIHERRRYLHRPRYAYVTLVMCGDEYAIGAAVLGWSLRKFGVQHELIVMVTPDVSIKARKLLMKIFDRVETVKYIQSMTQSTLRGREYRQEKEWMKFCLTKGNMMKFVEYDKIVWMDADMLALANLDEIFELSTPAGICTSIRDDERWHGERLPEAEIKESLSNNYGVKGCIMVLKPCVKDYLMAKSQQHVGHGGVYTGPDEYFYTMMYKNRWHHLDQKYGCSAVKAVFHFNRIVAYRSIFFCIQVISSTQVVRKQRNTLRFGTIRLKWKTGLSENNGIEPAAVHFDLAKPWQSKKAVSCPIIQKWWLFANDLIIEHPEFNNLLPIMETPSSQSRSWLFLSPVEKVSFKLRNDYKSERSETRKRRNEKIVGQQHTSRIL